ncbi:predicted protein [Uncinocarpus reesii 1704]|uniref:Uncharacterized protein n=1 Tax=Uncinocarpus reesii (strain UAMH 1704) TaxID=336963 RepID=C4JZI9_UNCRE|nr:uncharacterized protein UREG_07590 [Uncinocarpus reesii 1704]EEP82725.1 predicted protein [Uncinocarpus reesii 1704]
MVKVSSYKPQLGSSEKHPLWHSRISYMPPTRLKQNVVAPKERSNRSHVENDSPEKQARRYSFKRMPPRKRRLSVGVDGDFVIEDISHQDSGYDGDLEVIWPYQYEDAETDATTKQPSDAKRTGPRQPKRDELSRSGLIDWMDSLHCDSDKDTLRPKRCLKRKLRPSLENLHRRSSSLRSIHQGSDLKESGKSSSTPKKPRQDRQESSQGQDDRPAGIGSAPVKGQACSAGLSADLTFESSTATPDSMDLD